MNPRKGNDWKLNEDGTVTEDEKEVAEAFNHYFVTKIEDLKILFQRLFFL